jgi:FkbM family methyltransferase
MSLIDKLRFRVSRVLSQFLIYHRFFGASFLRYHLCTWLVPPANGPTICSTLFDIDILVDPVIGKGLEKKIYYFGAFEAGILSVFRGFLAEGDVFLDVGANIGFLSLVAARFVGGSGTVYAVEPHPETYKILQENIHINRIKNVCPMNIALGAEISEARIYDNPKRSRGAASLIRPSDATEQSGKPCRVTTIDILLEEGMCPPHLIKIDVEGFELEVLKGSRTLLSSPQAPALCVAFSGKYPVYGGNVLDIYYFIKSVNHYSFFKLKYGKEKPSQLLRISKEEDLLPYHNNIFCFLNKHLLSRAWLKKYLIESRPR